MLKGVCRIGDQIEGKCNAHALPKDVTGTWDTGSSISKSDGKGIVRENDTGTASCGHSFYAVKGSSISKTEGIGMMLVSDEVNIQGGVGNCTTGSSISNSN